MKENLDWIGFDDNKTAYLSSKPFVKIEAESGWQKYFFLFNMLETNTFHKYAQNKNKLAFEDFEDLQSELLKFNCCLFNLDTYKEEMKAIQASVVDNYLVLSSKKDSVKVGPVIDSSFVEVFNEVINSVLGNLVILK